MFLLHCHRCLHVFIRIKLLNFPEAQRTPFLNTRTSNWVSLAQKVSRKKYILKRITQLFFMFTGIIVVTARKRSLGQGNIFTPVCHSVHRGVCLSACWDTTPLQTRHPLDQAAPQTRHTPPRPAPPDQANPPRPGTHPRHRACWEIRSTRGRYASYWNAIL